jgi:hypothetical protein
MVLLSFPVGYVAHFYSLIFGDISRNIFLKGPGFLFSGPMPIIPLDKRHHLIKKGDVDQVAPVIDRPVVVMRGAVLAL